MKKEIQDALRKQTGPTTPGRRSIKVARPAKPAPTPKAPKPASKE